MQCLQCQRKVNSMVSVFSSDSTILWVKTDYSMKDHWRRAAKNGISILSETLLLVHRHHWFIRFTISRGNPLNFERDRPRKSFITNIKQLKHDCSAQRETFVFGQSSYHQPNMEFREKSFQRLVAKKIAGRKQTICMHNRQKTHHMAPSEKEWGGTKNFLELLIQNESFHPMCLISNSKDLKRNKYGRVSIY